MTSVGVSLPFLLSVDCSWELVEGLGEVVPDDEVDDGGDGPPFPLGIPVREASIDADGGGSGWPGPSDDLWAVGIFEVEEEEEEGAEGARGRLEGEIDLVEVGDLVPVLFVLFVLLVSGLVCCAGDFTDGDPLVVELGDVVGRGVGLLGMELVEEEVPDRLSLFVLPEGLIGGSDMSSGRQFIRLVKKA